MKQIPLSGDEESPDHISISIEAEIIKLLNVHGINDLVDFEKGDNLAVEKRLQEIMMERTRFSTFKLTKYLMATARRQFYLQTWQPLLNATIEQAIMRHDDTRFLLSLQKLKPQQVSVAPNYQRGNK